MVYKRKHLKEFLVTVFLLVVCTVQSVAQCSMCRAVVESDISGKGSGINNGIVYLMAFPYVLIIGVAFGLFYKLRKDQRQLKQP